MATLRAALLRSSGGDRVNKLVILELQNMLKPLRFYHNFSINYRGFFVRIQVVEKGISEG